MIPYLLLLGFVICTISNPNAPKTAKYFDIVLKDKIVGSLEVSRSTQDSTTYYNSTTSIKTRLIKNIEVDYKYDVVFDDRMLKKADVQITVNDRPHAETITLWKEGHYRILKKGHEEITMIGPIDYTTILLYFKEPVNIDRCYSEQDGSLNSIIRLGDHSYKKINAKGKENTYHYQNGVLTNAVIDGGIVRFNIIARE